MTIRLSGGVQCYLLGGRPLSDDFQRLGATDDETLANAGCAIVARYRQWYGDDYDATFKDGLRTVGVVLPWPQDKSKDPGTPLREFVALTVDGSAVWVRVRSEDAAARLTEATIELPAVFDSGYDEGEQATQAAISESVWLDMLKEPLTVVESTHSEKHPATTSLVLGLQEAVAQAQERAWLRVQREAAYARAREEAEPVLQADRARPQVLAVVAGIHRASGLPGGGAPPSPASPTSLPRGGRETAAKHSP